MPSKCADGDFALGQYLPKQGREVCYEMVMCWYVQKGHWQEAQRNAREDGDEDGDGVEMKQTPHQRLQADN